MTRMRWWTDQLIISLVAFAGLIIGGFVAMGLAWRLVNRTEIVGAQVPPLLSGGIGGLGLIVLGAGLIVVQLGRQRAANERDEMERALEEAWALADSLRPRRRGGSRG